MTKGDRARLVVVEEEEAAMSAKPVAKLAAPAYLVVCIGRGNVPVAIREYP